MVASDSPIGFHHMAPEQSDPTSLFPWLPIEQRATERGRTREAFAARLEADPRGAPPNWPVHLGGEGIKRRLECGIVNEAWTVWTVWVAA